MASPKVTAAAIPGKKDKTGLTEADIANIKTRIKKELDSQWKWVELIMFWELFSRILAKVNLPMKMLQLWERMGLVAS
jgi:hypothetical protein